ncbi:MAG: hypothetical protein H8E21_05450 [Gammaproteobacteria bacterium]|nr:hypothetical protein [Gammaproteobacteria bacterium]
MAAKKPATKKTPLTDPTVDKALDPKPVAAKKARVKKAPVKKATAAKPAPQATTDAEITKTQAAKIQNDSIMLTTIQTIVEEMRQEQVNRDKQITTLVQEMQQGFNTQSQRSDQTNAERDREMVKLYQSLQGAFSSVKQSSADGEDRSLQILKTLSESIMQDHELTLKEVQEQDKLHEKKFQHLSQVEEKRAGRNRWIAIPGMILGIIAIIYMFYVVSVMEKAMTSMSSDMGHMQLAVGNMSQKMDGMSQDTHSMSSVLLLLNTSVGEMSQDTSSMHSSMLNLNSNVGQMSQDLNILTHNVSPTMKGMRDIMPWSP